MWVRKESASTPLADLLGVLPIVVGAVVVDQLPGRLARLQALGGNGGGGVGNTAGLQVVRYEP